jgi:ribonuclease R
MLKNVTINDPHHQREAKKYDQPVASRELLLSIISQAHSPLTFKAICQVLNYRDESRCIGVKRRLRAMENAGQLTFNKFKQYVIASKEQRLTGKVIGHKDGYGFFSADAQSHLYRESNRAKITLFLLMKCSEFFMVILLRPY